MPIPPASLAPRPPPEVQPPGSPDLAHLLTVVVSVVVVAALYFARDVLIPVTLAVLLSFVVSPVVGLLRRIGLWRAPSVLLAVVLALGVILTLGSVIGVQIAGLARDVPRYQVTIQQKVDTVRGTVLSRMDEVLSRFSGPASRLQPDAPAAADRPAAPGGAAPGTLGEGGTTGEQRPVPVEIRQGDASPLELAQRLLSPVLGPLETTFIVFIVAVFMLLQREDLRDRLIRLFGSDDLHRTTAALDDAGSRLSRYFLAQLALNALFGVVIAVGLAFIGVPSPILWGILAALFRFVPYVGAVLAAVLPIALAAAVDPGWSTVAWTAALFFITEPVMGQVVEPMVYGHSTGLSPLAVIVAAIFWTWLWGPIGLILATPLTLCLVVLGRHVERLEFLDVLLGDRPALTPVENFYQRMLAGDADEALAQAETLLAERSLSSYYDEVALKGLQLAANDAGRGVLPQGKLESIRTTVTSLVEDLADREDETPAPSRKSVAQESSVAEKALPSTPPPDVALPPADQRPGYWGSPGAVLCLAGRGPLDEAASAMLAQILGKHGLGARVLPHEISSRAQIRSLNPEGVAMVCISYLDISGSPAHLRYLLRRLKQQLPGVPLLVGLWPAEEGVLKDRQMQQAIGADHYTASLQEAVSACLKAAQQAAAPERSAA
ncbi:AI-2E family transporter [Roseomonas sp. BN140053]|uniref:AI-2E family transporter n=1 Tax=Roseomonas sp. BN140053 TaxID=3391898 RepID=UPI0039E87E40